MEAPAADVILQRLLDAESQIDDLEMLLERVHAYAEAMAAAATKIMAITAPAD